MIKCASVTPLDEGAQDVLIDALKPLGFDAIDVTRGEIRNTFFMLGDGRDKSKKHFCYAGHTDVVPPGDESKWTSPPFAAEIKDGFMIGCGTADMKGNNAVFAAACSRFIEKHGAPDGTISLLITGDEEAKAVDGTIKVLQWMDEEDLIPISHLLANHRIQTILAR